MWFGLTRKKTPNIYLGRMGVVPKESWKRADEKGLFRYEDFEAALERLLVETFSLQPLEKRCIVKEDDLVLDIFVSRYQGGLFDGVFSAEFFVPIFWRPKVELKARLASVKTGKIVTVQVSRAKMRWRRYLSGLLSFKSMVGFSPMFAVRDMEPLFIEAAHALLVKLKRAARV